MTKAVSMAEKMKKMETSICKSVDSLDAPSMLQHVIIRGIRSKKMFKDSQSSVVYTVNKMERIAKERNYQLLE